MKIEDVLAKVGKGEELTDAEKAFLKDYKEPDVEAEVNSRSKKERVKLEKQIADLKTDMATAAEELESAKEGGSEVEKLKREAEKNKTKLEKAAADLEAANLSHAETNRTNALNGVEINWLKGVSPKYKDSVLQEAFEGIETEDLSDESIVTPIVKKIIANNERFITAEAAGGAGTGTGEQGTKKETGKPGAIPTAGDFKGKSQKEAEEMTKKAWDEPPKEG